MIRPIRNNSTERSVIVEFDKADLESGIRAVAVDRDRFAVGRVRRRHSGDAIRLIVDRFAPVAGVPNGNQRAALSDYAVLTCRFDGHPAVEEIPDRVGASRSQLVVCICFDHEHHDRLQILLSDRGVVTVVDSLRVVGSGGFRVANQVQQEPFDLTDERRQFLEVRDSRTLGALGQRLLKKVRQLCLVNVSAGGGGAALATQLASLRPRRMLVFDPQRPGPENLNAMLHATELDVAQQVPKAEILAAAIEAHQPDMHVNGLPWSIADTRSTQFLEGIQVDGFFSFPDGDVGRVATAHLARQQHAVHVDVGTRIRWEGEDRIMEADIRLFEGGDGRGCVLCVPEMPEDRREAAFYELNAPPGALHRGQPTAWNDPVHGRAGSLLLLNTIAAAIAVDLWLAWLDGKIPTSHWRRITWRFGDPFTTESFDVTGLPGCVLCGAG